MLLGEFTYQEVLDLLAESEDDMSEEEGVDSCLDALKDSLQWGSKLYVAEKHLGTRYADKVGVTG